MGENPTVRLVRRTNLGYRAGVRSDASKVRQACEAWLKGANAAPPHMSDATDIWELVQQATPSDFQPNQYDLDDQKVGMIASHRLEADSPHDLTVGELIEQLQQLNPNARVELVIGEEESDYEDPYPIGEVSGYLNAIEVTD